MRLAELAEVLAEHGGLESEGIRCDFAPRGDVTITLAVDAKKKPAEFTEFWFALRKLADITNIRMLAERYDIDRERLEALLPK